MIPSLYKEYQRWSAKGSVYIISDTHFDDEDCKLMDPYWPSAEEQVLRIQKLVHKDDTLIHLGDVGKPDYMARIPGRKVLIMGNHDQSRTKFEPYFDEIYEGPLWIGPKILLSHEPVVCSPRIGDLHAGEPIVMNLHGHCHGVKFDLFVGYRNFCSDVIEYTPVSLGKLIKQGLLSEISDIHRHTIDRVTAKCTRAYFEGQMTLEDWINECKESKEAN
jgi:calcineurin-like phosphoesterase family protein